MKTNFAYLFDECYSLLIRKMKQIPFSVVFVSDCNSEKTLGKKFCTWIIWRKTLANNADEYFFDNPGGFIV